MVRPALLEPELFVPTSTLFGAALLVLFFELVQELLRRLLAVAFRVVLGPAPQVGTRVFHRARGLPPELAVGTRGVRRKVEHVAGPAGDDFVGKIAAHSFAEGVDHLKHSAPATSAEIPGADAGLVRPQIIQRGKVASCQVEDVDVVPDGGAVVRGIVVAEYQELLTLAGSDLRQEWEEIIRHTRRVFAHDATRVGSCWVEVSQKSSIPLLYFMGLSIFLSLCTFGIDVIRDHQFGTEFRVPVGIGRAKRTFFGNGYHAWNSSGIAVDGRGRGIDNVCNVMFGGRGQ